MHPGTRRAAARAHGAHSSSSVSVRTARAAECAGCLSTHPCKPLFSPPPPLSFFLSRAHVRARSLSLTRTHIRTYWLPLDLSVGLATFHVHKRSHLFFPLSPTAPPRPPRPASQARMGSDIPQRGGLRARVCDRCRGHVGKRRVDTQQHSPGLLLQLLFMTTLTFLQQRAELICQNQARGC